MTKFVIVTYGYFVKVLKMSTEFMMGEKQANLYAISAYTKECMDFPEAIKNIIRQNPNEDIVFGTDISGGSVNNDLQKIVSADKKLHLVAGINLPFLLQFLTSDQQNISQEVNESIKASKKGNNHL